jgi:hypothetical protein
MSTATRESEFFSKFEDLLLNFKVNNSDLDFSSLFVQAIKEMEHNAIIRKAKIDIEIVFLIVIIFIYYYFKKFSLF